MIYHHRHEDYVRPFLEEYRRPTSLEECIKPYCQFPHQSKHECITMRYFTHSRSALYKLPERAGKLFARVTMIYRFFCRKQAANNSESQSTQKCDLAPESLMERTHRHNSPRRRDRAIWCNGRLPYIVNRFSRQSAFSPESRASRN